jgi:hypothetical protein
MMQSLCYDYVIGHHPVDHVVDRPVKVQGKVDSHSVQRSAGPVSGDLTRHCRHAVYSLLASLASISLKVSQASSRVPPSP